MFGLIAAALVLLAGLAFLAGELIRRDRLRLSATVEERKRTEIEAERREQAAVPWSVQITGGLSSQEVTFRIVRCWDGGKHLPPWRDMDEVEVASLDAMDYPSREEFLADFEKVRYSAEQLQLSMEAVRAAHSRAM